VTARLAAIGVPGRIGDALAEGTLIETPAVAAARSWLKTKAGILVLSGTVGCGKSVAAAWLLANNFSVEVPRLAGVEPSDWTPPPLRTWRTGAWVAAAALVEASDFAPEFWKPIRKAELVVIDEAGAERLDAKGRALGNFTELLRRRYDDGRRTVVTTNLPPAEWQRVYCESDGGRFRDRLAEAEVDFGRSPVVALTGPSMRGRGRTT
jgi:DNA replication protein DnaC